ncbi:MAG: glucan biosynthesis protein [Candidatus Binatia bacterium]
MRWYTSSKQEKQGDASFFEVREYGWITPAADWGKGFVKLVEIPSRKETNDNIVSYWMPRSLPPIGQPFEIAYRISDPGPDRIWCRASHSDAHRRRRQRRNEADRDRFCGAKN